MVNDSPTPTQKWFGHRQQPLTCQIVKLPVSVRQSRKGKKRNEEKRKVEA